MKFRRSTVLLASIALAACAAGPVRDAGPLHPAHDAESASSPALSGFVVAHAFHHEVKSAGGVQRQFVEHGWDYDRAVAVERISTPEGMLIARTDKPGLILRATTGSSTSPSTWSAAIRNLPIPWRCKAPNSRAVSSTCFRMIRCATCNPAVSTCWSRWTVDAGRSPRRSSTCSRRVSPIPVSIPS